MSTCGAQCSDIVQLEVVDDGEVDFLRQGEER